jgi:hypothetical protein
MFRDFSVCFQGSGVFLTGGSEADFGWITFVDERGGRTRATKALVVASGVRKPGSHKALLS